MRAGEQACTGGPAHPLGLQDFGPRIRQPRTGPALLRAQGQGCDSTPWAEAIALGEGCRQQISGPLLLKIGGTQAGARSDILPCPEDLIISPFKALGTQIHSWEPALFCDLSVCLYL